MANEQMPIRIAQAFGLTTSAFAAGIGYSIAYLSIPVIQLAPPHLKLREWAELYERAAKFMPPFATISSASFAYLAYKSTLSTTAQLYALAGALTIGIVPYTYLVAVPTNNSIYARLDAMNKLGDKAESAENEVPEEQSAYALVAKWQRIQIGRATISLCGAVAAVWAIFFQ